MQTSTEYLTRRSTGSLEEGIAGSTENVDATQTVSAKIMSICRNTLRWLVLVDVLLALSVLVLIAVLEFGIVPQQNIGFSCNDPKISFKFEGDTISMGVLLTGSIIFPLALIWIAEYTCHGCESYNVALGYAGSRLKQIWTWYGHYSVGFVILALICDVMKVFVGEPRPHFLDTCRPREAANCTDEYFQYYTCTNNVDSNWFVMDSSRSFPSGHSAISVYTTIFLVWYFETRLPRRTLFLRPWVQCMMFMWGITCSLTRIGDNRHHWWDVLAGDLLGAIIAVFIVLIPCRKFAADKSQNMPSLSDPIENGQINFINKNDQSIRKLFSHANVDIPEGRELRDIPATWKERVN